MRLLVKLAWALAAVPLAALIWLQTLSPRWFYEKPAEKLYEAETKLHEDVLARGGLEAVWTFDGGAMRGWYAGHLEAAPGERDPIGPSWPGTTSVPGRFGDARRFGGREDCHYRTGYTWKNRGQNFTAALWVKAAIFPERQDLLATTDAGQWGFRLDGDQLCFDVPLASGGTWTLSCPFNRRRTWTHVAFAADMEAGETRLWVDGERMATGPWQEMLLRDVPFCFGVVSTRKVRNPFRGELDDAGVWNRALGDDEIRKLATGGKSLEQFYGERSLLRRARKARVRLRTREILGRLRFDNWPWPTWGRPRYPTLTVSLSDGAWRHLSRGHARARASGCLPFGAAKPVDAILSIDGQTVRCKVGLFGAPTYYPDSLRPSYSLWPADGEDALPDGSPRWVASPPESCGWTEPLAGAWVAEETGLPVAARCRLVRFRSNGLDRGLYLLRDFSRSGGVAGLEPPCNKYLHPERTSGFERFWVDPDAASRTICGALRTFVSGDAKRRMEEELEQAGRAMKSDIWSPIPRKKRSRAIKQHLEAFKALPVGPAPAPEAMIDESLLTGENVSAWRVVSDLPLAAARTHIPEGATLEFRSLDPEWLDDDGRILTRPERCPVEVSVEARYSEASGQENTTVLRFRIMPDTYPVPAVSVWAGVPATKLKREDAVVEYFGAGTTKNEPEWAKSASLATRGGLQFRGNSSFIAPSLRRLFGIKLDTPHGLFPGSLTRSLQMINVGIDPIRIANPMAFDLFREFPTHGGWTNLAPRVFHAELFMNGRYVGLQEFAERVDDDLPGMGDAIFYRYETVPPREPDIKPTRPGPREGDFSGPLKAAKALFDEEMSPTWAPRVEEMLNLENFIDFQLLSNLFGNLNGRPKHWIFDEIAVFDKTRGKFFYVPWDFDLTLRETTSWVQTDSDRRLWKDFPDYEARVAARWRELRAGCLAPERLRRIAEDWLEKLEPALLSDWPVWHSPENGPPAKRIAELFDAKLTCLETRARALDERFAMPDNAPRGDLAEPAESPAPPAQVPTNEQPPPQ